MNKSKEENLLAKKCQVLDEKMDLLLQTLLQERLLAHDEEENEEADARKEEVISYSFFFKVEILLFLLTVKITE